MILLDFSAISVAVATNPSVPTEEDILRHSILNSVRYLRSKFKNTHGDMVICLDSRHSWRKGVFEHYKASRKGTKEKSSFDWDEIHRIINMITKELEENFPYKVIQVDTCEADDIIGVLSRHIQEPIMICSGDKDFVQLQSNIFVKQYSSRIQDFIVEHKPEEFLFNHICKGDPADGIPNILSDGDTFVTLDKRQTPLSKKKIEKWFENADDLSIHMLKSEYRRFLRNKSLIDLSEVPQELQEKIINKFDNQVVAPKTKVMEYLAHHRCRKLLENIEDFIR